jgi:hypothetical protein
VKNNDPGLIEPVMRELAAPELSDVGPARHPGESAAGRQRNPPLKRRTSAAPHTVHHSPEE